MKRWQLLVVAVIVVVAAFLLVPRWRRPAPEPPAGSPAAARASPAPPSTPAPPPKAPPKPARAERLAARPAEPVAAAAPAPAAAPTAQEAPAPETAGGWVLGRVRSVQGGPVAHFSVNGRPVSDPDGVFRVEAPPDGTVKVVIRAEGFATALVRAHDVRGEKVLPDVVLERDVAALAEIVDAATEAPVPDAHAALADQEEVEEAWASGEPMTRLVEPAATGRGGMLRLDRVPSGHWLLLVQHPDYRLELAELRPPDQTTRVALHHGGSVSGRVVDASGQPLAGARVVAVSRSALDATEGRSDAEGRFGFGPLHPGRYAVLAASPGASAQPLGSFPVEVRDGEVAAADFKARSSGATVRVRILDASGRATAADALLAPGEVARPASLAGLLESTPVYPASGRGPLQVIASVPAGRHTLFVLRRPGEPIWSETVEVPASGDLDLEVRLPGAMALALYPRRFQ
jgi:hypothetical protein